MSLDLIFRLSIAGAVCTGFGLYFRTTARWVKQCHLLLGILAAVLCTITYLKK